MVIGRAGRRLFQCLLLFGVLNNFKHFIKNAVSNAIFIIKEWN
jgi:hypothetical protein